MINKKVLKVRKKSLLSSCKLIPSGIIILIIWCFWKHLSCIGWCSSEDLTQAVYETASRRLLIDFDSVNNIQCVLTWNVSEADAACDFVRQSVRVCGSSRWENSTAESRGRRRHYLSHISPNWLMVLHMPVKTGYKLIKAKLKATHCMQTPSYTHIIYTKQTNTDTVVIPS